MNSYYLTHYKVEERAGTVSSSVLGVYKIKAFTLDEAETKARRAIPSRPTYEYFLYSASAPKGMEVKDVL